jgi:hypothetical protein
MLAMRQLMGQRAQGLCLSAQRLNMAQGPRMQLVGIALAAL